MNVIPASLSITNLETLKGKLDVLNPKLFTLRLVPRTTSVVSDLFIYLLARSVT